MAIVHKKYPTMQFVTMRRINARNGKYYALEMGVIKLLLPINWTIIPIVPAHTALCHVGWSAGKPCLLRSGETYLAPEQNKN